MALSPWFVLSSHTGLKLLTCCALMCRRKRDPKPFFFSLFFFPFFFVFLLCVSLCFISLVVTHWTVVKAFACSSTYTVNSRDKNLSLPYLTTTDGRRKRRTTVSIRRRDVCCGQVGESKDGEPVFIYKYPYTNVLLCPPFRGCVTSTRVRFWIKALTLVFEGHQCNRNFSIMGALCVRLCLLKQ